MKSPPTVGKPEKQPRKLRRSAFVCWARELSGGSLPYECEPVSPRSSAFRVRLPLLTPRCLPLSHAPHASPRRAPLTSCTLTPSRAAPGALLSSVPE